MHRFRHCLIRSVRAIFMLALVPALVLTATPAQAEVLLCRATALADIVMPRSIKDSDRTVLVVALKRGDSIAASQFRVNLRTGEKAICGHGDYCYPLRQRVAGVLVPVLRLNDTCAVDPDVSYADGEERYHGFIVGNPGAIDPALLRRDDLDQQFSAIGGLCDSCLRNIIAFYMQKPDSACAALAGQALAGAADAQATLRTFPSYCQFW